MAMLMALPAIAGSAIIPLILFAGPLWKSATGSYRSKAVLINFETRQSRQGRNAAGAKVAVGAIRPEV
jgi:hypothetical protein